MKHGPVWLNGRLTEAGVDIGQMRRRAAAKGLLVSRKGSRLPADYAGSHRSCATFHRPFRCERGWYQCSDVGKALGVHPCTVWSIARRAWCEGRSIGEALKAALRSVEPAHEVNRSRTFHEELRRAGIF